MRFEAVSEEVLDRRVWPLVEKTSTCWIWRGSRHPGGYGQLGRLTATGRTELAHRLVYTLLVGPIPDGLTLDHICRNRLCVNPDHLEVVTPGVNVLRGIGLSAVNARKVRCKRGHPFDSANTRVNGRGERQCRACHREYMRTWRRH